MNLQATNSRHDIGQDANKHMTSINPESLSNAELIEHCKRLGSISMASRRIFIGLLPLVARREAYDRKKFSSIHHFASVIGGVGYYLVEEVLRLDAQLKRFPLLRRELYKGKIGWAKIRLVISSVKEDDQERWIELIYGLSKPALEVYLRDTRKQKEEENNLFSNAISAELKNNSVDAGCALAENISQSLLPGKSAIFEAKSFPGKTSAEEDITAKQADLSVKRETITFSVSQWLAAQLRLFRRKLEREQKRWITWEDALAELIKNADR